MIKHFWKPSETNFDNECSGRFEHDFDRIEQRLNQKLPLVLKALYAKQNGGGIWPTQMRFSNNLTESFINGSRFFCLEKFTSLYELSLGFLEKSHLEEHYEKINASSVEHLKKLICISNLWGHSALCLDYGSRQLKLLEEPEVCLLEEDGEFYKEKGRLSSFTSFLENLSYSGEECSSLYLGIASDKPIAEVASQLNLNNDQKIDCIQKLNRYQDESYSGEVFGTNFNLAANQRTTGTYIFPESKNSKFIMEFDFSAQKSAFLLKKIFLKLNDLFAKTHTTYDILLEPVFEDRPNTAPNDLPFHTHCEPELNMGLPADWVKVDDQLLRIHWADSKDPKVTFKMHISAPVPNADLLNTVEHNLQLYKKAWKIIERKTIIIDRIPAEEILLTTTIGKQLFIQLKTFIFKNSQVFIATASAPADLFSARIRDFEAIFNSLHWL